uniref:EGF-like domain-containing protein n=1 Tax=Petromyzon marinus TaxID=7757 RepID=S4RG17_PETMA
DTNECANSTLNDCAENATCANTQGSYNCTCNAGFTDPSSVVAGRTCLGECHPSQSHSPRDDRWKDTRRGSIRNVSSTAAPHPPSTLPTAYPASAMTVTCDGSYLYVRMPKAKLALSGVQPADVYLGLRSCGAQQGATSDSLEFKSGWSDCGTKVNSVSGATAPSKTLLTNTLKSGVFAGEPSLLSITVFCALSNNVNASMGFPASGGFVINDTVYGTGWYSVSLQMWQNNSSLSTAPVLGTNDKLVLKVNIASANAHITAVMQTCWATPGPSQTDAQRMELITNKCATTNTDLKIIESGTSTAASFELTLYKYVTYAMTYIHCSIGICLTTAQN